MEPGDPVGTPRKATRRKPYRLPWNHIVQALLEPHHYKVTKAMEAQHFEGCLHCQTVDAAYWALDAGDDRYYPWLWILDEFGTLAPKALYRVERYESPLLRSFPKWCRYHGWATKDLKAIIAYQEALEKASRVQATWLGSEVWSNPLGLVRIEQL